MVLQIPKEEEKNMAKLVSFWAKPNSIERLDALCNSTHIERSEVLRALVNLFLNEYPIQDRIMEEVKRNHV